MAINLNICERLTQVLGGRKPHTWGKTCGFNTGLIHRFMHGGNLGAEILIVVQRKENVSLSWLLDGQGAPYLINQTQTALTTGAMLIAMLEQCAQWQVFCITLDDMVCTFVLVRNNIMQRGDSEPLNYTEVEIICGPPEGLDPLLVDHHTARSARPVKFILADAIFYDRLRNGQVGSYEIISAYAQEFDLAPATENWPVFSATYQSLCTPPIGERGFAHVDARQERMHRLYKRWSALSEEKKQALETFMDLAAPEHKDPTQKQ